MGVARLDPVISQKVRLQKNAIVQVPFVDAEDNANDDKSNESADDVAVRLSLGTVVTPH